MKQKKKGKTSISVTVNHGVYGMNHEARLFSINNNEKPAMLQDKTDKSSRL